MGLQEKLGVLALGLFVGFLLGLGLLHTRPNLRAVLTVIGAALGGAPVAFLAAAQAKWLYPLGLLGGLVSTRVASARGELAARPLGEKPGATVFAWIDLTVAVLVLLGLGVIAIVTPGPTTTLSGRIQVQDTNSYEIYYQQPFAQPPHLDVSPRGYVTFELLEQRANGFKVKVRGYSTGSSLSWAASGEPRAAR